MPSASYTSCTLVLVYVYVLRHKSVSRVVGLVARLIKSSQSVSQCLRSSSTSWSRPDGRLADLAPLAPTTTMGDQARDALRRCRRQRSEACMVPSRVGGLLRGRDPSPLMTPSSAALCGFFVLSSVQYGSCCTAVWPSGKACTSFVLYSNKDLLGQKNSAYKEPRISGM